MFGPDYYHINFGDGPLPVQRLVDNPKITFVILKFSQGTSYGDWAVEQALRVRGSRLILGGYHMLDGDSVGNGVEQARYFLGKYQPQRGDICPIVDFESSGQGSASLASYRDRLKDFIDAIHNQGFECMLYGHATVKAAFADWRGSGADYWWCPGSSLHSDVGPRGPDLWQYAPYTVDAGNTPDGWPTHPAGNPREDVSKVITSLPIIGGGDDEMFEEFEDGMQAYLDGKDLNPDWTARKQRGWRLLNSIGKARDLAKEAKDSAVVALAEAEVAKTLPGPADHAHPIPAHVHGREIPAE